MTIRWNRQTLVLAAIVVVLLLILWSWYSTQPRVLDASNDKQMSDLFDRLNPSLATTPAAQSAQVAMASNTGIMPPGFSSMPGMQPIFIATANGLPTA